MTGCSAAAAQYASPGWLAQHPCTQGASLPFTGFDLIILLAVAVTLLAVGLALQIGAQRG